MNKRIGWLSFVLLVGFALMAGSLQGAEKGSSLRILTVGNSFANDATHFLPEMVKAGGKELVLFKANLGGCSLKRHADLLKAFDADPSLPANRPYKKEGKDYSLKEALESDRWDFVTIQQLSNDSFKPETFEPHAGEIIAAIRKYAPGAEIVIHQTWAYREDYPGFAKGDSSQAAMYEGLEKAYTLLAKQYGLRIIPVGKAMQVARSQPRWTFQFPDPDFDYVNPKEGLIPRQNGSLNAGWAWPKNKVTGIPEFKLDFKHANSHGRYLGAAVFYEFFFKENVENNPFVPEKMTPGDAASLRKIAHSVLTENTRK